MLCDGYGGRCKHTGRLDPESVRAVHHTQNGRSRRLDHAKVSHPYLNEALLSTSAFLDGGGHGLLNEEDDACARALACAVRSMATNVSQTKQRS